MLFTIILTKTDQESGSNFVVCPLSFIQTDNFLMVEKKNDLIYEGLPCMAGSASVIINIVDITYSSLVIQRNANK